MKPTPAKPRIIIAHVEGSGTAVVNDKLTPGNTKDDPIMLTTVMGSSGSPFNAVPTTIVSPVSPPFVADPLGSNALYRPNV